MGKLYFLANRVVVSTDPKKRSIKLKNGTGVKEFLIKEEDSINYKIAMHMKPGTVLHFRGFSERRCGCQEEYYIDRISEIVIGNKKYSRRRY